MKKIFATLFIAAACTAQAQTFVTEANIEYEKTINLKKAMAKSNIPDAFKEGTPDEFKTYYNLLYKNNQSIYQKGRDAEMKNVPMWGGGAQDDRKIFNNYITGQTTIRKNISWEEYFVQDSIYNINWKITMDTRTIAGYECRRATGVVFDSVFVVAFYTDQITGNGGPESFGGLPGMILGIVIPRTHTSWYATSVRTALVSKEPEQVQAPKPGKKTKQLKYSELIDKINDKTRNWTWESDNNHKYIWSVLW